MLVAFPVYILLYQPESTSAFKRTTTTTMKAGNETLDFRLIFGSNEASRSIEESTDNLRLERTFLSTEFAPIFEINLHHRASELFLNSGIRFEDDYENSKGG